jgi:hypothetical protein
VPISRQTSRESADAVHSFKFAFSKRTTEAWAAANAHGVTLVNAKIDEARQKVRAKIVDRAAQCATKVIQSFGRFNVLGQRHCGRSPRPRMRAGSGAPRGGQWRAMSVRKVMARA